MELLGLPPVDIQEFEAWKMAYPLTVAEKKTAQAAAPLAPPPVANEVVAALLQKIQRFRLETASPMDCFMFVRDLKDMANY